MEERIKLIKKSTRWKSPSLIAYLLLISVVLLYTFKSEIVPYFYRIKFSSPVIFNNIRINFPKGVIFNKDESTISFYEWEHPKAFLFVGKMKSNRMNKESLVQFFKKKNFYILEVKDMLFKNYRSFSISYIDNSWEYNKAIFVIPMNLRITYQGSKEDYEKFKKIIDNMEFL